jgi:NADH-quinone oxidoreductase subunit F
MTHDSFDNATASTGSSSSSRVARLGSVADLDAFRERLILAGTSDRPRLVVCAGTACQASGSSELVRSLKRYIVQHKLQGRLSLRVTGCHGFCEAGPFILTEPQNTFYGHVGLGDVPRLVDAVLSGGYVEDLLVRDPVTGTPYYDRDDIPFFKNQRRSVLGYNQRIDPIRIEDYVAAGGYAALATVLSRNEPEWVLDQVKRSGLRGRGGGGFPTGLKWELLAKQKNGSGKVLVCNADEGDPGAYMDRSVLEGNPNSIIEGMLIGAFATGASEGIVYVRTEYPIAIKHMSIALRQARSLGLLGPSILGTDFGFDIGVVRGAGAFVCGEETALMRSIEGKPAEPRQRPPYPVQRGIDGKPTAINNVETWANIPLVLKLGAEQFARVGTQGNSGTKIFSLVGKIRNTGLVEVPMGITIRQIVDDIGGGPSTKARIKAVQTGGPSGGCIPRDRFDLPIDYDSLTKAGSIMGSGGMIVMDENTCMVDVAKYFMNFLKAESCGKCFTCRKGTQRMYEILEDISKGQATLEHLDLLEELAAVVRDTTLCGLGQTASNPVFSTLRYFRKEYERHVVDKRCDAYVCSDLVGAPCQSACPLGTEPWRYVALLEKGQYEAAYRAIREPNPFPSVCARVCDRKCEQRCRLGTTGGEAIALRALKRFVTEHVDPSVYRPARVRRSAAEMAQVAVVGAGPAGLAAAHELSLRGYKVTLFEADLEPGGMLTSSIPAYRLPLDVVKKEIASLIDENVALRCGVALGRDVSLDDLFAQGFRAVFLAIGAHKSWRLDLEGEDVAGVFPSLEFLKAYNLRGEQWARGRVAVIGGGNAAVDAARVALRQKDVQSVCLVYRRTYEDMPAYEEEIEAALEEGVTLQTLVTPVKLRYIDAAVSEGVTLETLVSPIKIHSRAGQLTSIDCIRNRLGEVDSSGRRKPVPISGTEFTVDCDTLIVAIGERPDSDALPAMGLKVDRGGRLVVDPATLATSREGVFAGGDVVTGPFTVVDAIAAGKKAAAVIERYLDGLPLTEPATSSLPQVYVEPTAAEPEGGAPPVRVVPETLPVLARTKNFAEVEQTVSVAAAVREARRCLRCDLAFTRRDACCSALEERQP